MSGASADAVLTALTAVWAAAAPAGVAVIDGPPYDPPSNFLAVGWEREGQAATTVSLSTLTVSTQRLQEIDVLSLLSFSVDAGEITTARRQLVAAFDLFAAALAGNARLGGAAVRAEITEYDVTPILTEAGSVIDLRFTTHVTAVK